MEVSTTLLGLANMAGRILAPVVVLGPSLALGQAPVGPAQIPALIARMETTYALVESYQNETTVKLYRDGRLVRTQRFLYTFRKPNHVRADLRSPHAGTVLIYPDATGKVFVKLGGWLGFLKLHLALDSAALRSPAGQRVDQTDLGLLIRNIAHSLTDRRHGDVAITQDDGAVVAEVLADDHFLPGVLTLYHFRIDEATGLPVAVEEFTPEGVPKRVVLFQDLKTFMGAPAHVLIGANPNDAATER